MNRLLEVWNIKEYFPVRKSLFRQPLWVRAVDDVSFYIDEGETLGLVGESGCGKSTIGLLILCLLQPTEGGILFQDKNIFSLPQNERLGFRRNVQIIFQDPYSSLNPRKTVKEVLSRPFRIHRVAKKRDDVRDMLVALLEDVGLTPPESFLNRYPHEMSGGQRQRVAIARAIALKPKLVIADEAVSSLDVSIRAQILNLMKDFQNKYNLAYLFITHDLATLRSVSHRVAVMYLGKLVEVGATEEVFQNPLHPYTKALLASVPVPDPVYSRQREPIVLSGDVPSPVTPPPGCRFHTRCSIAKESCQSKEPLLLDVGNGHLVACAGGQ
jgi:peptide/nickel transport system ATP-binding protein/oligopeptide transport system ATP-binding protein